MADRQISTSRQVQHLRKQQEYFDQSFHYSEHITDAAENTFLKTASRPADLQPTLLDNAFILSKTAGIRDTTVAILLTIETS
jgi:hypothetical protein